MGMFLHACVCWFLVGNVSVSAVSCRWQPSGGCTTWCCIDRDSRYQTLMLSSQVWQLPVGAAVGLVTLKALYCPLPIRA